MSLSATWRGATVSQVLQHNNYHRAYEDMSTAQSFPRTRAYFKGFQVVGQVVGHIGGEQKWRRCRRRGDGLWEGEKF